MAQINEQLAIRNRRTANVWKIICLCSLIVICILIGKIFFGGSISKNTSNAMLPDKIEASNVRFYGNENDYGDIEIVNAADYWTGEERKRCIILACKRKYGIWKFPKKASRRLSLWQVIGD